MGGPGEPPDGVPQGAPGGGEDEYRSVVFDESFVRAARLQEYSAQERITDHAPAVRRRVPPRRGHSRQLLVLVVLIAAAFATAIYMGVRNPYPDFRTGTVPESARMTVIPLVPQGGVPGATNPAVLYDHSPAAQFATGAEGVALPPTQRTAHFSDTQVVAALSTVKDYIVGSALDPQVLTGRSVHEVRMLIDPDQLAQFDASFTHPAGDGQHAPTGWLVRFDSSQVQLAGPGARVRGTLSVAETDSSTLEVTAAHTFVYALRPVGSGQDAKVSLFTVRRETVFHIDRDDLRTRQLRVVMSDVEAGPLSCAGDSFSALRPLLAGQHAKPGGPVGTNPYVTGSTTAVCGSLAAGAQPKPAG